jgi:hypothetical protein
MSTFTVHRGKRYRAIISLSWWEQIATNEMIAQKLRDVGFSEVKVTGEDHLREAKALWPLKDTTAQIPSQVSSIQEIEVTVASR